MNEWMTYINLGLRARKFLLVQLLCSFFIGRIFKVWSEKPEMILFLGCIVLLSDIEFGILCSDFLLDETSVSDSDVMVGASRDLLAQILQSLR